MYFLLYFSFISIFFFSCVLKLHSKHFIWYTVAVVVLGVVRTFAHFSLHIQNQKLIFFQQFFSLLYLVFCIYFYVVIVFSVLLQLVSLLCFVFFMCWNQNHFLVFLSFIYRIPVYLQSSSGTPSFAAYKSNCLWVPYIRCCCCLLALHILLLASIFAPSQSYNHDDIHRKTALAHFNEYEYVISKI